MYIRVYVEPSDSSSDEDDPSSYRHSHTIPTTSRRATQRRFGQNLDLDLVELIIIQTVVIGKMLKMKMITNSKTTLSFVK